MKTETAAAALCSGGTPATPDERRFVGAALACIYAGDYAEVEAILFDLPPAQYEAIVRRISDKLAQHATVTGDWRIWAEAQWHLRLPALHTEAEPLRSLDAIRRNIALARRPDACRRHLAGLAIRLMRHHATGHEMMTRLHGANEAFPEPLPDEVVGQIAIWAARTVRESTDAAR